MQTLGISSNTAASIHSTTPPPVITWGRIQVEGAGTETAGGEGAGAETAGAVEEVEDMEGILNRYSFSHFA